MIVEDEDHFPPVTEAFVWVAGMLGGERGEGEGGSRAQDSHPFQLSLSGGRKQASTPTEPAALLQLALLEAQLSKCKLSPESRHTGKPNQLLG